MELTLWPVACKTCRKIIGHLQKQYENLLSEIIDMRLRHGFSREEAIHGIVRNGNIILPPVIGDVLDIMNLRPCCRAMIISLPQLAPGSIVTSSNVEETSADVKSLYSRPPRTHTMKSTLLAMQSATSPSLSAPRLPPLTAGQLVAPSPSEVVPSAPQDLPEPEVRPSKKEEEKVYTQPRIRFWYEAV